MDADLLMQTIAEVLKKIEDYAISNRAEFEALGQADRNALPHALEETFVHGESSFHERTSINVHSLYASAYEDSTNLR